MPRKQHAHFRLRRNNQHIGCFGLPARDRHFHALAAPRKLPCGSRSPSASRFIELARASPGVFRTDGVTFSTEDGEDRGDKPPRNNTVQGLQKPKRIRRSASLKWNFSAERLYLEKSCFSNGIFALDAGILASGFLRCPSRPS